MDEGYYTMIIHPPPPFFILILEIIKLQYNKITLSGYVSPDDFWFIKM